MWKLMIPKKLKTFYSDSYLSNKFFKIAFTKKVNGINSVDDNKNI